MYNSVTQVMGLMRVLKDFSDDESHGHNRSQHIMLHLELGLC